jgi:hypothetical protein
MEKIQELCSIGSRDTAFVRFTKALISLQGRDIQLMYLKKRKKSVVPFGKQQRVS